MDLVTHSPALEKTDEDLYNVDVVEGDVKCEKMLVKSSATDCAQLSEKQFARLETLRPTINRFSEGRIDKFKNVKVNAGK